MDDVAIFLAPIKEELATVGAILRKFGDTTGLVTNFHNNAAIPIRCDEIDLSDTLQHLQTPVALLPCQYLGMPLSLRKLRYAELQPLLDKFSSRLAAWKNLLISKGGRLILLNTVYNGLLIYIMTAHALPRRFIKQIDKRRRAWLWHGQEECHGGHCLVKWEKVCRPKELGGLGTLDLAKFDRALRLHWFWQEWTAPNKAWIGMKISCDDTDRALFAMATKNRTREWEESQVLTGWMIA